jgi:multiple sugar transport system permease protein
VRALSQPPTRQAAAAATAGLVVVAAVMALPVAYLLSLALRTNDDVLNGGFLPSEVVWGNWGEVFDTIPFATMLANSWAVALGSALLTGLVAVPAAYVTARSRRHGPGLLALLLASYCAPPVVAVLPLYFLLKSAGLTNSVLGLILVTGLANVPVAVWLLDGFVRRLPVEIEEAAWLDGLTPVGSLLRVVVPLVAPGIVAALLVCLFLAYNEFLFAVSFSQRTDSQTLTVGLSLFQGDRRVQFGQQAAASIMAIVPMYVLAVAAQRWLVSGLTHGATR